MGEKIMVALSGGVDSSVAMLLLKQQGLDISAAYMKTWINEEAEDAFGDCPWHEDVLSAQGAAEKLGVEFEVVDFIKEYREEIVEYLVQGYRSGMTPNPDVMCNRRMKFGKFLDYAKNRGFGGVATGHYCAKTENYDGSFDLIMGADPSKDQSYFLAMITQEQLKRAHFPIGCLLKSEVRELARFGELPNSEKKDSQGICFLGKIKIQDFLKKYIPETEGNIVDSRGKILGKHKGLHNYTIGQRRGIGVPSNTDNKNYVVLAKRFKENELLIGFESQDAPELYKSEIFVENPNWINLPIEDERTLTARVRYRDDPVKIKYTPISKSEAKVEFEKAQRALAPGQVMAMYDENILLGGAFFRTF